MTTRRPTVLVLGDSASASVGVVEETYPELLAHGRLPLRVINAALIGMTSLDATALLPRLLDELAPGDAVVVCLGHCDAAGFGPLKPRFPVLGAPLRRLLQPWYQSLNPWSIREAPYRFAPRSSAIELLPCVAPDEFEANLADLVRLSRRRGLRVLILNPFGRRWFPPANHTPCSLFLRVFGSGERHAFPAGAGGDDVLHALSQHQEGHDEAAAWLYRRLLESSDPTTRAVAMNNLAEIAFARGELDRAIGLAGRASREPTPVAVLPAYNRALALRQLGFVDAANRAADAVLDEDRGSYRISPAHRAAAARVAERYASEDCLYIDLADVLSEDDVLDYCHPTPSGHRRIADAAEPVLARWFELRPAKTDENGVFETRLGNPDAALGGDEDFLDHFHLRGEASAAGSVSTVQPTSAPEPGYDRVLAAISGDAAPPDGMDRAACDTLAHPLLGLSALRARVTSSEPTDRGAAPSFFRLRLGASLFSDPRGHARAVKEYPALSGLVPRPRRVREWCRSLGIEGRTVPLATLREAVATSVESGELFARIERRLDLALADPQGRAGTRARTSRSWFFREALWFGTPSSPWCFGDREGVAAAAESLVAIDLLTDSDAIRAKAAGALERLAGRIAECGPSAPARRLKAAS